MSWLPRIPRFHQLVPPVTAAPVSKKVVPSVSKETHCIDKDLFQRAMQSAQRLAEANKAIDSGILEKQYRINATAMAELDAMKAERKELLSATDKLCKKFDMLKYKYDDLLEKYNYLKKMNNKRNNPK